MQNQKPHQFSQSEIREAEHRLAHGIRKYFGEAWRIKFDGEYQGVSWDCRSPLLFDVGIWRLLQGVIHRMGIS